MNQGCIILHPYDMEMGAGTFHPTTVMHTLNTHPWRAAYIQPSRRPSDGRYGKNPIRTQHYYQYQVILKPSPRDVQDLSFNSFSVIGIDIKSHDIRFVEDNWESPTLGASGLGWEVWCDGLEVAQFTYFQKMGGFECYPITVEITYGLERLAMVVQECEEIFLLDWNGSKGEKKITYGDIYKRSEKEFSIYNFDYLNVENLRRHFFDAETECTFLLKKKLSFPAYDQCLKSTHLFNLLDAKGVLSVSERTSFIRRIRFMVKGCCKIWIDPCNDVRTKC